MAQLFAVLVGVNQYPLADIDGSYDLKGAVNDVRAWWDLLRKTGVPAENIRVLTAPRVTPEELGAWPAAIGGSMAQVVADNFTGATKREILEALAWLRGRVGDGDAGFVFYGGQSFFSQLNGHKVLHLCPTDLGFTFERDEVQAVQNALSYPMLRTLGGATGVDAHITCFLDCCYAGYAGTVDDLAPRQGTASPAPGAPVLGQRRLRRLSGAALPLDADEAAHPSGGGDLGRDHLCFAATTSDELAYEGVFNGRWHGAATWAVMRTLEYTPLMPRFDEDPATHPTGFNISFRELRRRTSQLLDAVRFEQQTALAGGFQDLEHFVYAPVSAVLSPRRLPAWRDGETRFDGGGREIWGGADEFRKYDIFLNGDTRVGRVFSAQSDEEAPGPPPTENRWVEYWNLDLEHIATTYDQGGPSLVLRLEKNDDFDKCTIKPADDFLEDWHRFQAGPSTLTWRSTGTASSSQRWFKRQMPPGKTHDDLQEGAIRFIGFFMPAPGADGWIGFIRKHSGTASKLGPAPKTDQYPLHFHKVPHTAVPPLPTTKPADGMGPFISTTIPETGGIPVDQNGNVLVCPANCP